jgi:small redox-active disulfide protein 2
MKSIKILGPGCPKCRKLFEATQAAADELGLECDIVKVTGIAEITAYGVMMTPALVVDEKVKLVGKIPAVDELKKIIAE